MITFALIKDCNCMNTHQVFLIQKTIQYQYSIKKLSYLGGEQTKQECYAKNLLCVWKSPKYFFVETKSGKIHVRLFF